MLKIEKLLQQRAKAIADLRAIADAADAEKRALSAEDRTKIDAIEADIAMIEGRVEFEKKLEEREADLRKSQPVGGSRDGAPAKDSSGNSRATPEYRAAFNRYILTGEARDLLQTNDQQGGYLLADEQFNKELIADLANQVAVRQIARVRPPIKGVKSIGNPRLAARMSSAAWGSEVSTPAYDTSLKFGKRKMLPNIMTGGIKVSRTLLYNSEMDPAGIVREEMSRDFAELEENAFLTGNGAEQPLGLLTASNDGIGTARDINTGLATGLTADGLVTIVETLDSRYHPNAKWLVHNDFVLKVRLMKDGQGQYIWRSGLQDGKPDSLLGFPIQRGSLVSKTFTNGLYVGIFGDFSWYWIVDSDQVEMQRLVELYAESNLDAFIARRYVDGAPVKAEAFCRIKCAA